MTFNGRRILLSWAAVLLTIGTGYAQSPSAPLPGKEPRDLLHLDATVTTTIQPDTAVIVLAVDKQGTDPAALTAEVNQILARGLAEAKAARGVQASSGAYHTHPRYDNKGQRNGWIVRAELILKGKDFAVLGTLAGKLSKDLSVASNGAEISPELREKEEAALTERAIAAFRAKATAAAKAFGFGGYTIREVAVGQIGGGMPIAPKTMMMARAGPAAEAAPPMPIEPGSRELTLTVSGTVQMMN